MNFQEQKKKQLSKIDKSNISSWDEKIKGLCEELNKNKNYYTTSSCSGRVVLLKESEKKQKDLFLFRKHGKISFQELRKALGNLEYKGLIYFKQESCILHVACKSLEDAQRLVDKAKLAGWKRSGIMSIKRNIVELLSTESISFPIMYKKKVLVDDDFLKLVVRESNKKLERVWKKIEKLKDLI